MAVAATVCHVLLHRIIDSATSTSVVLSKEATRLATSVKSFLVRCSYSPAIILFGCIICLS
jgi:preprotein translocase subunit SecG